MNRKEIGIAALSAVATFAATSLFTDSIKGIARHLERRFDIEIATARYQGGEEGRREGFLEAVCVAEEVGMLDLNSSGKEGLEATGSYNEDAQSAGHEIEMAASECRRTED